MAQCKEKSESAGELPVVFTRDAARMHSLPRKSHVIIIIKAYYNLTQKSLRIMRVPTTAKSVPRLTDETFVFGCKLPSFASADSDMSSDFCFVAEPTRN